MAETACLVRSFSQPAELSSHRANEGDPVRALTESVSFGRFMSESLAWEKWSTFSHNRYLEEIEKFSKPGSVAQKKAFFEEHYKKRAAMKAAAAAQKVLEEETATRNVDPEGEIQKDDPHINSEVPMMVMNTMGKVIEEERQIEVSGTEADSKMDETTTTTIVEQLKASSSEKSVDVSKNQKRSIPESSNTSICSASSSSSGKSNKKSIHMLQDSPRSSKSGSKAVGGESDKRKKLPASSVHMSINVDSARQTGRVSQKTLISRANAMALGEADKKKKLPASSVHMSINVDSARQTGRVSQKTLISRANAMALGEADKKKLPASSVHMSINVDSARQTGRVSQKTLISGANAMALGEADKKKLPASSVHMSINVDSARQTGRVSQKTLISRANAMALGEADKKKKRWVLSSVHMSINLRSNTSKATHGTARKDDLNSANCSTRASVIGLSKHPLKKNQPSEDKRKNTIVDRSISGKTLENPKMQSSVNRGKPLSPSGSTVRSSTVFSLFSFRSAERAEKRKQFFKKIEEKQNNQKEATKEQLPPKSKNSPRFTRNRTPISINVRSSHLQPPQKVSSANVIGREDAREKHKLNKIHPTSLPKKKTQENLSPKHPR